MNPDLKKQLEAAITREFQKLAEVPAPETLVARVMTRLSFPCSAVVSQCWPTWLWVCEWRVLLLLALLADLFWRLEIVSGGKRLGAPTKWALASTVSAIWSVLGALAGAAILSLKQSTLLFCGPFLAFSVTPLASVGHCGFRYARRQKIIYENNNTKLEYYTMVGALSLARRRASSRHEANETIVTTTPKRDRNDECLRRHFHNET